MGRKSEPEFDQVETYTAEELEQAGYDSARIQADWGGRVMPADEAETYRR